MIIAWFSCGVTSAVACKLAIDHYGIDNVRIVYIKINSAHPDNDRFISECEKWYGKPIEVIQSSKAGDQFEVAEKGFINSPYGAPCTRVLKKDVRFEFEKNNPFKNQIFGFEYSKKEMNRAIRFTQQYPHTKPLYPLIDQKIDKNKAAYMLSTAGIELPKMYQLGYPNNNCIGCVKGGKGYWNKIRKDFPEQFKRMSNIEQQVGASCIKGRYLKDLKPNEGVKSKMVIPDCGLFCEVEGADIWHPDTLKEFGT